MANEDGIVDKTVKTKLPTVDEINAVLSQPIKDPLVGTKLAGGRYEILEVLGEGGMSVVYKAKQELVDRIVAIKTLKLQLLTDPMLIKRFDREVKTLSRLNHPNIVTVYDCIVSETGQPYFVMDYLQGHSLQDLLLTDERLSPRRARNIFVQVCNAVEHAHRNGIVHRDLKPANIMLTDISGQEFVKVVDFGLAKIGEDAQRLTQTGELWGSPLYMSPEQCSGYTMDARSDIYSLGAVMYEALTGHVPFRGTSFLDTISKQVAGVPPKFSEVAPALAIPAEIERIVMRALEKNPDQRYQSMVELKDVIERVFPIDDGSERAIPITKSVVDKAAAMPTRELKREVAGEAATKRLRRPEAGVANASEPSPGRATPSKAISSSSGKSSANKADSANSNTLFAAIIGGLIAAGAVLAVSLINNQSGPPAPPVIAPAVQPVQATVAPTKPAVPPVQTAAPTKPAVQSGSSTLIAPPVVAVPPPAKNDSSVSQPVDATLNINSGGKPVPAKTFASGFDAGRGAGAPGSNAAPKSARKPHKAAQAKVHKGSPPTPYVNRKQSAHELDDKDVWDRMQKY